MCAVGSGTGTGTIAVRALRRQKGLCEPLRISSPAATTGAQAQPRPWGWAPPEPGHPRPRAGPGLPGRPSAWEALGELARPGGAGRHPGSRGAGSRLLSAALPDHQIPAPSQKPRSAPAPCRRDSRLVATRAAHRKGLATPPPARRRRAPRDRGDKQHPLSHAGSTRLPTPAGRFRPARRPAARTPGLGALLGTRSPRGGGSRGFCAVPPTRDGPSRSVAIGAGQAGHERPTPGTAAALLLRGHVPLCRGSVFGWHPRPCPITGQCHCCTKRRF